MADRYWVGGTNNWDTTAGTKWATTSGGTGGSAVPTSSDNVFFDSNSGGNVTISGGGKTVSSFDCTGFTFSLTGGFTITVAGTSVAVKLASGMTFSNSITFTATSGTSTLTSFGKSIQGLSNSGKGGNVQLVDSIIVSTLVSNVANSSFDANNQNVTISSFLAYGNSSGSTITMGSGTWTFTGTGTVVSTGGLGTINAGTSTVKITNTSNANLSFNGGGNTWNNIWFTRGASTGSITISGSQTFNDFKDDGSAAHSLIFTAGTTQTLNTFTVSGSSGNLITINSDTTGTHTLSCASGTISSDYLNIQHSIATGGATWYAGTHSTNNQATSTAGSGWIFTNANTSNFFQFF